MAESSSGWTHSLLRRAGQQACAMTRGKSRMREFFTSGSVRGVRSNPHPYRDHVKPD
jgi:hypothetical protein